MKNIKNLAVVLGARVKRLNFQTYIVSASALSLLLTGSVLGFLFSYVNQMIGIQHEVEHSQDFVARMNVISNFMVDMETGERGFLISGDAAYLEPYDKAEEGFDKFLQETKALVAENPELVSRLEQIQKKKSDWIAGPAISEMMAKRLESAGRIPHQQFVVSFLGSKGKEYTDAFRSEVTQAVDKENKAIESLSHRNIQLAKNIQLGAYIVTLTMLFGFGLVLFATSVVSKMEASIRAANTTIAGMLNNMKLSVFTVGSNRKIVSPVSDYSKRVFGQEITDKDVMTQVFSSMKEGSEEFLSLMSAFVAVFGSNDMQWDLTVNQFPKKILLSRGPQMVRTLEISYSPLWSEEGLLEKILFVVDDVTEFLAMQERADQATKAHMQNITVLHELSELDQRIIEEFFSKAAASVQRCEVLLPAVLSNAPQLEELFRILHTLKGNSRIYKLSLLSSIIHMIESEVSKIRNSSVEKDSAESKFQEIQEGLDQIKSTAGTYTKVAEKIFKIKDPFSDETGDSQTSSDVQKNPEKVFEVYESQLQRLRAVVNELNAPAEVKKRVENEIGALCEVPLNVLAQRLRNLVEESARKSKKEVHLSVNTDNKSVSAKSLYILQDILVHLIQNSLDHGIESPQDRIAVGKSKTAGIDLCFRKDSQTELAVTFKDDGKGIVLKKVFDKAVEKGLIKSDQRLTDDQIVDLVFSSGFSTADQLTETSGRGVGMDAVKKLIESKGGKLRLSNREGLGLEAAFTIQLND